MSRLKSKGSVQARQRTDCLLSNHKTLVHLRIDGPAAALADIPQVSELLTGVMAGADEVLAKGFLTPRCFRRSTVEKGFALARPLAFSSDAPREPRNRRFVNVTFGGSRSVRTCSTASRQKISIVSTKRLIHNSRRFIHNEC
jgi:hypothetical protein